MKAGHLSILLEDHPTAGKVFVIRVSNDKKNFFQIFEEPGQEGYGNLVLRVTPETMLLVSQYVDEMFSDDVQGLSSETH